MPLNKDKAGGGTNGDGSKSNMYWQPLLPGRKIHAAPIIRRPNAGYRKGQI